MDTPSPPPPTLGKYEVRGTLGRGAMGTVYDGWDPIISRHVAIKTVPLLDRSDPEAQEGLARFRREAQAAGRLTHPNIVGVYDYGETHDAAYIVMEYVEGHSLKERLDRGERLPLDEIVRIMEQTLAALHFSHGRGVVHRDIKPGNMMMTRDGQVKLADFGIARIESSSMTQDGTMLGTPAYMSPEQLMAQPVDARSDIYSAGVVLYQLLTGGRPYEGGLSAIILKVFNTVPPPPSEVIGTISRNFDAVVACAMARPPGERYATAAAMAEAIREAFVATLRDPSPVDGQEDDATAIHIAPSERSTGPAPIRPTPTLSSPPVSTPKRGNAALLGGVAAVALLAIGGGAWFALGPPSAPVVTTPSVTTPPAVTSPPATPLPSVEKPAGAPTGSATAPPSASTRAAPHDVSPPHPPIEAVPEGTSAAAPDFAAIHERLANLGLVADCAVPRFEVLEEQHAAHVDVFGVVGAGSPEAGLRQAATVATGGVPLAWQATTVKDLYCGVLDMLRPIAQPIGSFDLALQGNPTRLRDYDPFTPILRMPEFPAYLVVDYISSDGSVARLFPAAGMPEKVSPANTVLPLTTRAVGPPFGTDIVVAVASSIPLNGQRRPGTDDTVKAYVPAMQAAIEAAQRKGARVVARIIPLQIIEK